MQRLLASSRQQFDPSQLQRPVNPPVWTVQRREGTIERFSRLSRLIDAEILPRLIVASRIDGAVPGDVPKDLRISPILSADVIDEFVDVVLTDEQDSALDYAEMIRERGVTVEGVYLDLLTPAARRLGELWESDEASFVQVTLALWRMQQVLRSLNPIFLGENCQTDHGRRVLIVSVPGEQHSFGIVMLSEFFRRSGWSVSGGPGLTLDDLLYRVRTEPYDIIGFSLSGDERLETLKTCIQRIRAESLNRKIGVLVGGRVFIDHPDFVSGVNADATASDARQAVIIADAVATRPDRG